MKSETRFRWPGRGCCRCCRCIRDSGRTGPGRPRQLSCSGCQRLTPAHRLEIKASLRRARVAPRRRRHPGGRDVARPGHRVGQGRIGQECVCACVCARRRIKQWPSRTRSPQNRQRVCARAPQNRESGARRDPKATRREGLSSPPAAPGKVPGRRRRPRHSRGHGRNERRISIPSMLARAQAFQIRAYARACTCKHAPARSLAQPHPRAHATTHPRMHALTHTYACAPAPAHTHARPWPGPLTGANLPAGRSGLLSVARARLRTDGFRTSLRSRSRGDPDPFEIQTGSGHR